MRAELIREDADTNRNIKEIEFIFKILIRQRMELI